MLADVENLKRERLKGEIIVYKYNLNKLLNNIIIKSKNKDEFKKTRTSKYQFYLSFLLKYYQFLYLISTYLYQHFVVLSPNNTLP